MRELSEGVPVSDHLDEGWEGAEDGREVHGHLLPGDLLPGDTDL